MHSERQETTDDCLIRGGQDDGVRGGGSASLGGNQDLNASDGSEPIAPSHPGQRHCSLSERSHHKISHRLSRDCVCVYVSVYVHELISTVREYGCCIE